MNDKTISDKMYLKTAKTLAVFNGNAHPGLVSQLPSQMITQGEAEADVVLVIATSHEELDQYFAQALARLGEKGSLWIAYLKQSAPKATDITRESLDAYAKERGVTDVALISVDADWSAVRLKRM